MLGVMYALVAVGFTLFFGVLDVIHFSHGDIFMLGAFAGLTVLVGLKAAGLGGPLVALPLTFAASILVTGLVGVAAERVCVKPLARASPLMTRSEERRVGKEGGYGWGRGDEERKRGMREVSMS